MIVTCEKCYTKYAVPDNSVGVMGRNVKCAKCGYTWLQMQENQENVNTKAEKQVSKRLETIGQSIDVEGSVGAVTKVAKKSSFNLRPIFFSLILIIFVLVTYKNALRNNFEWAENFYNSIGIYSGHGFVFEDFTIAFEELDHGYNIDLSGFIVNDTSKDINAPDLKISILDEAGNVIGVHILNHQGSKITAQNKVAILTKIQNVSEDAKHLKLMFVDKLDALL